MRNGILSKLVQDLRRKHKCHTLILYGSRARGEGNAASDYDLIGFRKSGAMVVHDARKIGRTYLDAFIYPEKFAKAPELLRARDGIVLFQQGKFGDRLLARLERLYERGPTKLTASEKAARKVWIRKMLDRAKQNDVEGNFRRAWLLYLLLEDYFALRDMWYEGPKAGFKWLRANKPPLSQLFERALRPNAKLSDVEKLARAVIGSAK